MPRNERGRYLYGKSCELPKLLEGDQIRLKQVMINLVKNALKFTIRGHIYILAAYDYENQMLKVHVVDTGKGIE